MVESYVSSLEEHLHVCHRGKQIFFLQRQANEDYRITSVSLRNQNWPAITELMRQSMFSPRFVSLDLDDSLVAWLRRRSLTLVLGYKDYEDQSLKSFLEPLPESTTLVITREISGDELRVLRESKSCRDVRLFNNLGSNIVAGLESAPHSQNRFFPVNALTARPSTFANIEAAFWKGRTPSYTGQFVTYAVALVFFIWLYQDSPQAMVWALATYGVATGWELRDMASVGQGLFDEKRQSSSSVPPLAAALPQSHFAAPSPRRVADQKETQVDQNAQMSDQEDDEQVATEHDRLIPDAKKNT